ncbi:MAG: ABC-type transport auxiliary lipoprotein family protein [Planctomycetota bacterium]
MSNRKSQTADRKWLAAALCAALPALAGCLWPERSYVQVTYYSIDPALRAAPSETPPDLALAVRAVESASRYHERILTRGDGHTVEYLEFERWVEPPAEMLTRALRRGLSEAHVSGVVADERLLRRPDVVVDGKLTRFDLVRGKAGWSAACELELVVKHADRNRVLAARRIAVTKAADASTVEAFVAAMNAAVADLVHQATETVDQALADADNQGPAP